MPKEKIQAADDFKKESERPQVKPKENTAEKKAEPKEKIQAADDVKLEKKKIEAEAKAPAKKGRISPVLIALALLILLVIIYKLVK